MARFKDPNIPAQALKTYLKPDEQLKHWAYGVKQPNIILLFFLALMGVIPFIVAVVFMSKEYVVGLTGQRFIVLRFKRKNIQVQEVWDYPLNNLPPIKTSTGSLFTHIKVLDSSKPFVAKFHRFGMPDNREHGIAIESVLNQKSV